MFSKFFRKDKSRRANRNRVVLQVEQLETRTTPAVLGAPPPFEFGPIQHRSR